MIIYYLTATQMQMILEAGVTPDTISKEGFTNIFTASDLCDIREKTEYLKSDGNILNQLGYTQEEKCTLTYLYSLRVKYGMTGIEDVLIGAACPTKDTMVVWETTLKSTSEGFDTQGTSDVPGITRTEKGARTNADELFSNSLDRLRGVDPTSASWVQGGYGNTSSSKATQLATVTTNNMSNGKRNVLSVLQALAQVITYDDLLNTRQFEISI